MPLIGRTHRRFHLAVAAALLAAYAGVVGSKQAQAQGLTIPAAAAPSGEKLFGQQCGACHSLTEGETRVGPTLYGIIGRVGGKLTGYAYSAALKRSTIRWDAASLDRWLADSNAAVPGSTMAYRQADPAKRKLIIDYLISSSGHRP
ncbi:MAG TPA: c-type cytochrome [Allosphingosinicella sp.]|nr:c-type cytochrome [Allosphingosinicella sp.]